MACPKCGKDEAHFAPPCFGSPGFYVCEHTTKPTFNVADGEKDFGFTVFPRIADGKRILSGCISIHADCLLEDDDTEEDIKARKELVRHNIVNKLKEIVAEWEID